MTEFFTHNGVIFKLHRSNHGLLTVLLRPTGDKQALWSIAGAYTEWVANKRWKEHGLNHDPFAEVDDA